MGELTLWERAGRKIGDTIPVGFGKLSASVGALSITFDDFPKSAWDIGGEILAANGVRGTYYVCGGLSRSAYRGLPHFDENDLHAIAEAGHEIGCHTFDHISTLRSSAQEISATIVKNAAFLNEVLPAFRPQTFAYPMGHVSLSAKRALVSRFAASRGVRPGLNGQRTELTNLLAFALEERQKARFDFAEAVKTAAKTKSWIIVFTHDIGSNPSPYGCKRHDLGALIGMAKDSGLEIAPVHEIFAARTKVPAA